MMVAKTLIPLLYIVLISSLLSRSILIEQVKTSGITGSTDRYVDNLIHLQNSSSFLRTRVTQVSTEIFTTTCPLNKVDRVGLRIGFNFAIIPGESIMQKLEN